MRRRNISHMSQLILGQAVKSGYSTQQDVEQMLGIAHETMRRRKVRGDWTTAELRILYKKLNWTAEEWVQLFKETG